MRDGTTQTDTAAQGSRPEGRGRALPGAITSATSSTVESFRMSMTLSSRKPGTSTAYRGSSMARSVLLELGWRSRMAWQSDGAESLTDFQARDLSPVQPGLEAHICRQD